jgi:hypothetical protein
MVDMLSTGGPGETYWISGTAIVVRHTQAVKGRSIGPPNHEYLAQDCPSSRRSNQEYSVAWRQDVDTLNERKRDNT